MRLYPLTPPFVFLVLLLVGFGSSWYVSAHTHHFIHIKGNLMFDESTGLPCTIRRPDYMGIPDGPDLGRVEVDPSNPDEGIVVASCQAVVANRDWRN